MIDLRYSLMIEATEEPDFFSFYSTDLEGFSGVGHSVENCLYKAKSGMAEHVTLLEQQGLPVPLPNPRPRIIIENAPVLSYAFALGDNSLSAGERYNRIASSIPRRASSSVSPAEAHPGNSGQTAE